MKDDIFGSKTFLITNVLFWTLGFIAGTEKLSSFSCYAYGAACRFPSQLYLLDGKFKKSAGNFHISLCILSSLFLIIMYKLLKKFKKRKKKKSKIFEFFLSFFRFKARAKRATKEMFLASLEIYTTFESNRKDYFQL